MSMKQAVATLAICLWLNMLSQAVAGPRDSRKESTTHRGTSVPAPIASADRGSLWSDLSSDKADFSVSNSARRLSATFETPTIASALAANSFQPPDPPIGRHWAESSRFFNQEPHGLSLEEELAAADAVEPLRIPEPASLVLLVTGLVGLTARRHIRRQRQCDSSDH